MSTRVKCPHCHTEIVWNSENIYRPFCSKRCKLIDFGDWANESHKIPANLIENPEDLYVENLEADNERELLN